MTATAVIRDELPFSTALERMDWRQGEHVTLIAPTGRGKTELLIRVQEQMPWCVFLGTKRIDDTQKRLRGMGYRLIADPKELNVELSRRFLFRPPFPRQISANQLRRLHASAFRELLTRIYRQTAWAALIDEGRYITDRLGLADEVELLWLQGRSQGNSVVFNTQRPRHVPLEAYDQATHLFFWQDPDEGNIRRIAEIASINKKAVLATVPHLPRHDVLYVNTVTGDTFITNTRW